MKKHIQNRCILSIVLTGHDNKTYTDKFATTNKHRGQNGGQKKEPAEKTRRESKTNLGRRLYLQKKIMKINK